MREAGVAFFAADLQGEVRGCVRGADAGQDGVVEAWARRPVIGTADRYIVSIGEAGRYDVVDTAGV